MKHQARKRFGQNFLTDPAIINDLIVAIRPEPEDLMVEIGPGLGAMTQPLLQQLQHLHVVELDRDIVHWLQQQYDSTKLTIHHTDALAFDFGSIGSKIRVVGNLPYNISTPILFHLLDHTDGIVDMHFMLQKEVVERMVAAPSTPAYGRLSVMLQYHLYMDCLLIVPPEAFDPIPRVESAFVRAIPHAQLPYPARDEVLLSRVVQTAFSQRRKTLRNTLRGLLNDSDFSALELDSRLRAEDLPVATFVAIANHLSTRTA